MMLLRRLRTPMLATAAAMARGAFGRVPMGIRQRFASIANCVETAAQAEIMANKAATKSTANTASNSVGKHVCYLFFDNLFPIKRNRLDFRPYLARMNGTSLLKLLTSRLIPHELPRHFVYAIEQVIPRVKDGGMFVKVAIEGGQDVPETFVSKINQHLRTRTLSWLEMLRGRRRVYLVRGEMFNEDIKTLTPSHRLRVEFWGPDLTIEKLYNAYRKYGRIVDIQLPSPASKDLPRAASVQFSKMRAATCAKNCTFNYRIGDTTIKTGYEKLIKTRFIVNWLASHPKVTLPAAVAFTVTTLYAIFDPIRIFFVESKIKQRFQLVQYLPIAIARVFGVHGTNWKKEYPAIANIFAGFEGEQAEAEVAQKYEGFELDNFNGGDVLLSKLKMKLYEKPDSFIVIVGPSGSGKSELAFTATTDSPYRIVIDCEEIMTKANNENEMLTLLAQQVGYFPVFPFLVYASNFVDSMVAATTGTKAGITSTTENQLKKIMECTAIALTRITREQEQFDAATTNAAVHHLAHSNDTIHPHEHIQSRSASTLSASQSGEQLNIEYHNLPKQQDNTEYPQPESHHPIYPVVILDNFLKDKTSKDFDYLYNVLAEWAAWLVENQIAHVLVVGATGQRGGGEVGVRRVLGKALPTKTFEVITLLDMNESMTRKYVSMQLNEIEIPNMDSIVTNVGGRVKDIELLVQKVKSGMSVSDAIEDLVSKSIIEIQKHGFGEENDDRKSIIWSPAQMWFVIKQFATVTEVSYDSIRASPIFKSDDEIIRAMERAELITLTYYNGRPTLIRPNKPMYLAAIRRMISDRRFTASMDSLLYKTLVESETAKLKVLEEEVFKIQTAYNQSFVPKEMVRRADFLLNQISASQIKVEEWTKLMKEGNKEISL